MQKILIEWKHFEKDGKTCQRCAQTGGNLTAVINELKTAYAEDGIEIQFLETKLPKSRMSESNQILIGGEPLETLIQGAQTGEDYCESCSRLIGDSQKCNCRTIEKNGQIFETIPVSLIKQAINNKLRLGDKAEERKLMKIQVFGSGCPACKKLYELVKQAVSELELDSEVEYVTDVQKIIEMGVMQSPVLAVDGKPVMAGLVPDLNAVKDALLKTNAYPKTACCGSGSCRCGKGNC